MIFAVTGQHVRPLHQRTIFKELKFVAGKGFEPMISLWEIPAYETGEMTTSLTRDIFYLCANGN